MSTGEVFLSAAQESLAKRMLTPLLEEDDDTIETNSQKLGSLIHPEFDLDYTDENQIFLTGDGVEAEYITTRPSETITTGSFAEDEHGLGKSCVTEIQNSDGEMYYDGVFSDEESAEENEGDYETDLEVDEEKWLHPERFDRDLTGKTKYIKVCEEMGISPTTYFIKHIQDRELKMKFHGLGPTRMRALSVPLETNTNIEILNLEGNAIDSEGAICITKVLKENFFITELVLADNKLGTEGGKCLSEMLVNNKNIYKIDLTANEIGDGAAPGFCEVLLNNKLLKTLLLGTNRFEDEGARLFKAAISDNTTLEVLDLSWNHFKTKGAIMLAEAIQENVGLKSFNMAMAGLGRDGAEAISKALKENRSLLELDISLNRIGLEGARDVAKGMKENDTLRVLRCGSNPFDSDGAMEILQAVDVNDISAVTLLDFSNIMVKIDFAKLQLKLQDERGIKIKSEGVIPEFTRTNSARLTAFRLDPIRTFKMYVEQAEIDLKNLLSDILDEDCSIDIKEFKKRVKTADMDISDEQIAIVVRKLCQDGRIYCGGLLDISEEDGEEDDEELTLTIPQAITETAAKKLDFSRMNTKSPGRNAIK